MTHKKTMKTLAFGLGICFLSIPEAKAFHNDWPFNQSIFKELDHPFFANSSFGSQMSETDKSILISFDVPGLSKEDINIHLKDHHVLVIDGKKEVKENKEDKKQHTAHYTNRSFYQSLRLPDMVDTSKIDAEVKNGVLIITIPKKPESQLKGQKIKVR